MNYNSTQLGGRLSRDIEVRYLPSGMAVAQFSLAINRTWKDKQTGEKREEVSFIDCDAFGKTGELLAQYLGKGDPVFVYGRLKQDTWQAQDGSNRSKLKVVVDGFQFVGGKQSGDQSGSNQSQGGYRQETQRPMTTQGDHVATDEDDIPF